MTNVSFYDKIFTWADRNQQVSPFHKTIQTVIKIICITSREFRRNELSLRSAALTYTIMLSLIPILAMSTAVIKGLGGGDQLRQVIYSYVNTLENNETTKDESTDQPMNSSTPEGIHEKAPETLTNHLHDAVDKIFDYVDRTNFARLGTFGVLGIILSVILVFGTIETAMNAIWNVESGRSLMRKISDYLALVILLPFSLNIGLAASTIVRSKGLQEKFNYLLPMVWVQPIILKLLPIFFLAISLYVIYIFFPNTKVKTFPAMIGSILAGFFWFEVQNIYISLQIGVSKYNAIYGSFATLPLFLIWMYCGWLFILAGAQLAFACQNYKYYQLSPLHAEASLQLSLAYDLRTFVLKSFENKQEKTLDDFQNIYTVYPPPLITNTAWKMIDHNLILQTGKRKVLKPSLPRNHFTDERVLAVIIGNSFSTTEGGKRSQSNLAHAAHSTENDNAAEEHLLPRTFPTLPNRENTHEIL